MKFIRWQLFLRLVLPEPDANPQGMTLQWAGIDCHTYFWKHRQFYIAISRIKAPVDLWISFPLDLEDFVSRPPVDLNVIQILERMNSSSASLLPDDHVDVPEDQINSVPTFDYNAAETMNSHASEILFNIDIMAGILGEQQMLRLGCPGHILTEISLGASVPSQCFSIG
jgi:hypothetical protein